MLGGKSRHEPAIVALTGAPKDDVGRPAQNDIARGAIS